MSDVTTGILFMLILLVLCSGLQLRWSEKLQERIEKLERSPMSRRSPMSLSLDYLNKMGWTCHIVEKWVPVANVRKDAFGFGDILAYKAGVALIQTTSWSNFMARRRKILANPHFAGWKRSGGRIFLHGWGDLGLREEEL